MEQTDNSQIKPDVLNFDDIAAMVPALAGHRKLVEWAMHAVSMDKVNDLHRHNCGTPGVPFTAGLLNELDITLKIDGEEILDRFPEGAFVTVSNHPFGALDGIALIYLISSRRPAYRVMVNMILNKISAMRPNFIAVDQSASADPAKRAVSVAGIRQALRQLKEGEPVGFFPAGAMSKTTLRDGLQDRPWQQSILQIIHRAKVPVIPIYFHGSNSRWFNFLGHACWPARSLRLPAEVFRKTGTEMHISIGRPISADEQAVYGESPETLGAYLREQTYALRSFK